MISAIEHLHESASNIEAPLAPTPLVYFLGDAEAHLGRLTIDTVAIQEFMEPQVDGNMFGHMFLGIIPKDQMGGVQGSVDEEPFKFEGNTHFPRIDLAVAPGEKPNVAKLNSTLRHELGHTLQPAAIAPYNNPKTVMQTRGVGSALLAVGTMLGSEHMQSIFETGALNAGSATAGLGAIGIAGAGALLAPKGLLREFGTREMQANLYAFRHRRFNPITYK